MEVIDYSDDTKLQVDKDRVIRYGKRLWVLGEDGLRKEILKEDSLFDILNPSKKH